MASLDAVLDAVRRVAEGGRLPIVVLDIDSTLLNTGPRHLRILRGFVTEEAPHLAATAADVTADEFRYLVEGPLVARDVTDPAVIGALRAYWAERFFTDALCREDRPNPGAVAFAKRVVEHGGLAYYLTARPADMAEGTLHVLRTWGFPVLRGRAVLHMKPSRQLDDHRFKRAAVAEIGSLNGQVIATFENEPRHAAMLLEAFPGAAHFLVGSIRSPDAPQPHPDLVPIPDFHV